LFPSSDVTREAHGSISSGRSGVLLDRIQREEKALKAAK
jgi:hypothetical protein